MYLYTFVLFIIFISRYLFLSHLFEPWAQGVAGPVVGCSPLFTAAFVNPNLLDLPQGNIQGNIFHNVFMNFLGGQCFMSVLRPSIRIFSSQYMKSNKYFLELG